MSQQRTPLNTLSKNDPGDEVQRRFRYQAGYAAIVSLSLLDKNSDFDAVYCEHHEDTLIQQKDGKFIGVQVKTRQVGLAPFKSDDRQIIESLKRFIEIEIEYPSYFSRFVLATNHGFWSEKKNMKNLAYLLESAKRVFVENNDGEERGLNNFIKTLKAKFDPNVDLTKIDILRTLCKVELQDNWPKFDDLESRLARHIPEYYEIGEAGFDDLLKAARTLINRMFEAGSLQHLSSKSMFVAIYKNPKDERINSVIEGKKITKDIIKTILEEIFAEIHLTTTDDIVLSQLPKGMRRLELKMAKGKISARNIRVTKDQKFSTEKLLNSWIYKYGPEKAKKYYKQLKVVIDNECQEAYDFNQTTFRPFGQKMLNTLRENLRNRYENDTELFLGCKYEHLLGIVGILTEICDVWWSKEFKIPEDLK